MNRIVIPTYNRSECLKKSLLSVLTQDLVMDNNFTVTVVDNGSNRETVEYLESVEALYTEHEGIDFRYLPQNIGKAKAVNFIAKDFKDGDNIISFDSDLICQNHDFFKRLVEAYESNRIMFSILVANLTGYANHVLALTKRVHISSNCGRILYHLHGEGTAGSCLIMNVGLFRNAGCYPEQYGMYGGDDGFLIHNNNIKNKLLTGIVEDLVLYHPQDEDAEYRQFKYDAIKSIQTTGKGPEKGFYDK